MTEQKESAQQSEAAGVRTVFLAGSSAEERLLTYLKSLPERKLTEEGVSIAAQEVWHRLRHLLMRVVPPNARPTDDGGLRMSWTTNGRYLEIEIAVSAATFEWFYRDTKAQVSDGGENVPVAEIPASLLDRLRELS